MEVIEECLEECLENDNIYKNKKSQISLAAGNKIWLPENCYF